MKHNTLCGIVCGRKNTTSFSLYRLSMLKIDLFLRCSFGSQAIENAKTKKAA